MNGLWAPRRPLDGMVWAELLTAGTRSLLSGSEAALDCLEPVLGRDPRGRDWQEFFPFDDRIVWLRLSRHTRGPAVRLRLRLAAVSPGSARD